MLFTLQRYEFFSKSQQGQKVGFTVKDVVSPTKVRIFQQITTELKPIFCESVMLFTLQRYEFFSKSQRGSEYPHDRNRCCLPYKGTNFSANHNEYRTDENGVKDVVYPTKVRIFQQITTTSDFCFI